MSQHFVGYSLAGGKLANFGGVVTLVGTEGTTWEGPWVQDSSREELKGLFEGWEDEVQVAIDVGIFFNTHLP